MQGWCEFELVVCFLIQDCQSTSRDVNVQVVEGQARADHRVAGLCLRVDETTEQMGLLCDGM